ATAPMPQPCSWWRSRRRTSTPSSGTASARSRSCWPSPRCCGPRGSSGRGWPPARPPSRATPCSHCSTSTCHDRPSAGSGRLASMALTPRRAPRQTPIVTDTEIHTDVRPGAAEAPPVVVPAVAPPLADMAAAAGLERVHMIAWRDLDDPEAGGSEVHAAHIASAWAAAGIDVTMRTSAAAGHPMFGTRDGYRTVRKSGRYSVFPRTAVSGALGRTGSGDGLVEIWNGMPFFSPLWSRCPTIVLLHHVHAEMWRMVLKPAALARVGEFIEFKLAPPVYRRSHILTLSSSSRAEIVELLRIPADRIEVVPPGISPSFSPGGARSPHPLVLAV